MLAVLGTMTKILKKKKRTCDVLMNLLYCNSSQLSGIKGLCNMCLPLVPLYFLVSCLAVGLGALSEPSWGSVGGFFTSCSVHTVFRMPR